MIDEFGMIKNKKKMRIGSEYEVIQGSRPRQRQYQPSLQEPKAKRKAATAGRTALALDGKRERMKSLLLKVSTIHNKIENPDSIFKIEEQNESNWRQKSLLQVRFWDQIPEIREDRRKQEQVFDCEEGTEEKRTDVE